MKSAGYQVVSVPGSNSRMRICKKTGYSVQELIIAVKFAQTFVICQKHIRLKKQPYNKADFAN